MATKQQVLEQYFGYASFREGQETLIDGVLGGRDVLGVMPTGGGKSLCYQVPALMMEGIALVVSPLISLMNDQVAALVQNGVRGAYLNSSLTWGQYRKALANAKAGVYKLIYVAPERLLTPEFLDFAQGASISLVAVDEAHCVSQWGQDFRPSYLTIPEFVGKLPRRPVVAAFTATATPRVREDICAHLQLRSPLSVVTGFDRPNLYFEVRTPKDKLRETLSLVEERRGRSGLVYCATRKSVEEVCQALRDRGVPATRYHAGLSDQERRQNQEDFLFDRATVMVATNAFGMGIDKSNVSFVIHYHMPKDPESYYQEAGRAGRDGSPAECVLLYSRGDVGLNRFLITHGDEGQYVEEETLERLARQQEQRLRAMENYCRTTGCLREYLLHYFGERAPAHCGNCRNCLARFEEVDITAEAREIASCVRYLGGRYGVRMVLDVLRGGKGQRLLGLGLQKLPCYGRLAARREEELRDMVNALELQGFLEQTQGEYPVLRLGPRGEDLLRGAAAASMRVRAGEAGAAAKRSPRDLPKADPALYEQLRRLRGELSRLGNVPAYVVFSNASLAAMAALQPASPQELLQVPGVGQAKLRQYGRPFLEEIQKWRQAQKG